MANAMLYRSSRTSLSPQNNGLAIGGIGVLLFTRKLFAFAVTISIAVLISLSLLPPLTTNTSGSNLARAGFSDDSIGVASIRRSVLAPKSDPLKPRIDQIKKQANDLRSQMLAYASYARKLKLENSRHARVELSYNYSDLISKPAYRRLIRWDAESVDESLLWKLEMEVKEWIKVTRQLISGAKEWFDYQLTIQRLKDKIFAKKEQLTKVKSKGSSPV